MRQSLHKGEILRGYGAFKTLLDHGRVISGKRLRIFVLGDSMDDADRERVRVGFGVGRKVESAVMRNRLKRLMREVVRRNKELYTERCREAAITRILLMCTPNRTPGHSSPNYRELETEFRSLIDRIVHR